MLAPEVGSGLSQVFGVMIIGGAGVAVGLALAAVGVVKRLSIK